MLNLCVFMVSIGGQQAIPPALPPVLTGVTETQSRLLMRILPWLRSHDDSKAEQLGQD